MLWHGDIDLDDDDDPGILCISSRSLSVSDTRKRWSQRTTSLCSPHTSPLQGTSPPPLPNTTMMTGRNHRSGQCHAPLAHNLHLINDESLFEVRSSRQAVSSCQSGMPTRVRRDQASTSVTPSSSASSQGMPVSQQMDHDVHYSPNLPPFYPAYQQNKSTVKKFQRQEATQMAPWGSNECSSNETLDSLSQTKHCACGSIHSNGAASMQDLASLYQQSSAQADEVEIVTLVPIKLRSSISYPIYSDACEDEDDTPLQLVPIEPYSSQFGSPTMTQASYVSTLKIDIRPTKRMKKSVSHELPKIAIHAVDRKRIVQSKSEGQLLKDPRKDVYTPSITVAHFLGKDSRVFLETHFPCWKEMTV